jgi:hypothetical protein
MVRLHPVRKYSNKKRCSPVSWTLNDRDARPKSPDEAFLSPGGAPSEGWNENIRVRRRPESRRLPSLLNFKLQENSIPGHHHDARSDGWWSGFDGSPNRAIADDHDTWSDRAMLFWFVAQSGDYLTSDYRSLSIGLCHEQNNLWDSGVD